MRWGPQTWILAPAPMPFRVRPQASSLPLCPSAAYSVNHPELHPPSPAAGLRNTPPAAAQSSCSRHCPCATPARPRDLETERKHPMPPRSTQSALGSTPPPNLSDCSKAWERERAPAVGYGRLGSDQGRASERRTQGCEAAAESGPHGRERPAHPAAARSWATGQRASAGFAQTWPLGGPPPRCLESGFRQGFLPTTRTWASVCKQQS